MHLFPGVRLRKHKSTRPVPQRRFDSFTSHILLLSTQAADQLAQLALTVHAQISLDTAVEPEHPEDAVETFATPEQIAVMRRSLHAALLQHVKSLQASLDTLYARTAELELLQ